MPEVLLTVGIHGVTRMSDNNFHDDLEYSKSAGLSEFIDNAYRRAFPHVEEIKVVEDIGLQLLGIDKILVTENGKEIYVDEKIRRKHYGDIALEEYSDYDRKVKGWLSREKYTDYIAYIIPCAKLIYFLPFLILQKVYVRHYKQLLALYGRKPSYNQGYTTTFIAVPTSKLLDLIRQEMHFSIPDLQNEIAMVVRETQLEFIYKLSGRR